MKNDTEIFRYYFSCLVDCRAIGFVVLLLIPAITFAEQVRLGVLMDVPKDEVSHGFVKILADEVRATLGTSRPLRLDDADIRSTEWNYSSSVAQYRELASYCDIVVLLGSGSIREVVGEGDFPCPTIGLGVFEPQLEGIPINEIGVSGVKNFSYILPSYDLARELAVFRRMTPFKHLTLLFDYRFAPDLENAAAQVAELESALQSSVAVSVLTKEIEESLGNIPDATDAVYLWAPYGMKPEILETIASNLLNRKIPAFAVTREAVDAGFVGCVAADNARAQMIRKLAIMVDDAMRGEDLAGIPVAINHRQELYLNRATIRQLELSTPFELLFTAEFAELTTAEGVPSYGVRSLVDHALVENLGLKVSQLNVAIANQAQRTAKSNYLPSINLNSSYSVVNEEQTSPVMGQAERTLSGAVSLDQLLFSAEANANISIQSHLKQAEAAAQEQVALDVILGVFDRYFDVLRLKTNVAIQEENLTVSRRNLELAHVRVSLGASNRADLFRWESEVASGTQNVIEAYLQMQVGKKALDTFLNGMLSEEYDIEDEQLNGALYQTLAQSLIGNQLDGPRNFTLLLHFLNEEAQRGNPSKHELNSRLRSIERQHTLNQRRFFLPTLSANASLINIFDRDGAGSESLDGSAFNDELWSASINLSFPLFDGNRRRIDRQTTTLQQRQLRHQIGDFDQNLSLAIQSAATDLLAASTNIRFSQISAENTAKNFELLQDSYSKGAVTLLNVLDAQKAALQAKQGHAVSIYDYMTALMGLESLLGEYSLLATPEDNQALRQRFTAFVAKQEGQQ